MKEFQLLQHIFAANADLPGSITLPPGDDMGAVRLSAGVEVLVTVDQVADGVHFELAHTPLEKIARKTITRNLSDVAAMACKPIGAVVAACLPQSLGQDRALALFDGLRKEARRYGCPLFGGDVSMWDGKLILSLTVLAEAWPGIKPVTRAGARPGDLVFVTGKLGASFPSGWHLLFEPRIEAARELAAREDTRPTAMIDLSDGLARDLGHICQMSGVSAEIEAQRLPIRTEAYHLPDGLPGWRHALGDGEDYELCFTLPAENESCLPKTIRGVPITRVGRILPQDDNPTVWITHDDGQRLSAQGMGWEHGQAFKAP